MLQVLLALVPAVGYYTYLFGEMVLLHLLVAIGSAYVAEYIVLVVKGTPVAKMKATLLDHSSILTAVLLALSVPFNLPWEILCFGVFFAVIMGKHIFGGLGHNIFNPAMIGYAVLLISFPIEMTNWSYFALDGVSGATVLDGTKHDLAIYPTAYELVIVNSLFAVGGLYLLFRGIITWHTPLVIIVVIALLGIGIDGSFMHILFGATLFGAFFIATDGVSSPTGYRGRIIYAILIGVLTVIIREFGNYPDGFAFAILIANMCAPLIDYYVKR